MGVFVVVIMLVIAFLLGAGVMFLVYRKNQKKFNAIADAVQKGGNPEDVVKDVATIIRN
jgi:preprotein translocase subunit YajC